jgi:alpha-1,2-mannosyltransferase
MTSNDANGIVPANRPSFRCDVAVVQAPEPSENKSLESPDRNETSASWARIERAWWVGLVGAMLVFSAFPMVNLFLGLSTKDYGLWYQVGLAVRQGLDVYPRPQTGRLFPFMYPPSAAAMLGWVSLLGPLGSLVALLLANSAAWVVCIWLSVWLAAGRQARRHPLVVIVPSLSIIVLVYNVYLLGQPNLMLLALLLGSFACLRLGRPIGAGALLATAAAIKAFPILALGYLIYRRMWTASAATVAVLTAWLLLAPLPFRTPEQAVDDLVVWSKGMLFTYNTHGIAQRPFRSYSYKNQSIMALAHRLLRDLPADGETVLSKRARLAGPRTFKGLPPVDPSTDLLRFLKPHAQTDMTKRASSGLAIAANSTPFRPGNAEITPRWDDSLQGAEAALRAAWRVNIADLNFRVVTAITLAVMLGLCIFVIAVLPPRNRRTPQSDALEFALVTLLTVVFSPLSFNYAYVWLIYPTTLAVYLVISESPASPRHRLKVAWITAVVFIPALAIPMPLLAQAYGNLLVPALLLVFGLGMMLSATGHPSTGSADLVSANSPLQKSHAVSSSSKAAIRFGVSVSAK